MINPSCSWSELLNSSWGLVQQKMQMGMDRSLIGQQQQQQQRLPSVQLFSNQLLLLQLNHTLHFPLQSRTWSHDYMEKNTCTTQIEILVVQVFESAQIRVLLCPVLFTHNLIISWQQTLITESHWSENRGN